MSKLNLSDKTIIKLLKLKELKEATGKELAEKEYWDYENQMATMEDGSEYLVLTDEEADKQAETEIKNSLWAFIPKFIIEHMTNMKYSKSLEDTISQMQRSLCEGANDIVAAMVDDVEEFCNDAIVADGRGHFISWYDGEEIETENFFIYRIN